MYKRQLVSPALSGQVGDTGLMQILTAYFAGGFKSEEYYNLHHETDLACNEVYNFVCKVFDDRETFYDNSVNLARHLYEAGTCLLYTSPLMRRTTCGVSSVCSGIGSVACSFMTPPACSCVSASWRSRLGVPILGLLPKKSCNTASILWLLKSFFILV